MFGKKQKLEKLEAFEAALAVAKAALALDDIQAIKDARSDLYETWAAADSPPSYGTRAMATELDKRLDVLTRRPLEQALRPCSYCSGRAFRISTERNLEYFGDLRLVVCESCGLTLVFWANLATLDSSRLFYPTVKVPEGGGPFR